MKSHATVLALVLLSAFASVGVDPPQTGPETEKRFPPLKVPDGFNATLFACDPLIEYPSAIALGPAPGSLFVAVDYMTGLGTAIVRRDEIRLIEDTDGDGYADKATVYADGFNSIEGMTFHDGVVYAMHSPLLTALRDTDGDGVADERRDLLAGLGLAPEDNPVRLHCANGITWGFDGWLYLALGDHGCDVPRPEGDRLVFNGGGILRCRTDGHDLHVFSTGLRNIYDVALDDELNVFVRDNENDGGDYKIRVCHSFFGADHGYPYLYYERPDEALPPLADLGLGSSAGGVCYLETQFPPDFRGNLFFCEWGRAVTRYPLARSGSGFAPVKEIEFAAGADNDPYGFKPTDLVVDRDGSLLVADWADGQRPKRGRARIYRVSATPGAANDSAGSLQRPTLEQLASDSYYRRVEAQRRYHHSAADGFRWIHDAMRRDELPTRGRLHAVWILARCESVDEAERLVVLSFLAEYDDVLQVRIQAVRAIADLLDPVLRDHRLASRRSDDAFAERLAKLADGADARLQLEIVVTLGRMCWRGTPQLAARLAFKRDPALSHAVMQALRRSQNWSAMLNLIDEPPRESVRAAALAALADQAVPEVVDGLIARVRAEPDSARRRVYADLLTRVHRKPGPWTYWGYRPPPRPANSVEWERTPQIKHAVNAMLLDPDRTVRLAVLRRMQREKIPTILDTIEAWLADERDPERVAAIVEILSEHPAPSVRAMLLTIVREREHAATNRVSALSQVAAGLDETSENRLAELSAEVEDGAVLAAILNQTAKRTKLPIDALLVQKLSSGSADVRVAAVDALAERRVAEAGPKVQTLLDDSEASVRRAAADAAGRLQIRSAIEPLLKLTGDGDPAVRRATLESLRLLREPRVLAPAAAAINDSETLLAALGCIGEFGSIEHAGLVASAAKRNPSADVFRQAVSLLTRWGKRDGLSPQSRESLDRTVAELQGTSGIVIRWNTLGPVPTEFATRIAPEASLPGQPPLERDNESAHWKIDLPSSNDPNFAMSLGTSGTSAHESTWLCLGDVQVAERADVQFTASSSGTLRVWLNGRTIHERPQAGAFQPDSDRFDGTLVAGSNCLVVQVSATMLPVQFHARFRRKSTRSEHEQLIQTALARPGNAERGRKLFFDAEKSQCIKCHRLGDQGERIGPELTGVGNRFSRIHIIESILEPSRTLAPSYESLLVALTDGRILTGLRVAESNTTLTLADNQAVKHSIEKTAIEERRAQPTSIMPDGLEKRFTTDEFVDLIGFLTSQR